MGFQVVLAVKNSPANAGDIRDAGSIPGLGGSLGGGHGNPLQFYHLESPMDRGAGRLWFIGSQRVRSDLAWLGSAKPMVYCGLG